MNTYDYSTLEDALKTAILEEIGYAPAELIADGKLHRFSTDKDTRDKAGWYQGYFDGRPNAVFGDYRTGYKGRWKWNDPDYKPPTPTERKLRAKAIEDRKQEAAQQLETQYLQAAQEALAIWNKAQPASQAHPYLQRKLCLPYGVRVDANNHLVIPLADVKGNLWSLQYISTALTKNKKLLPKAKKKGTFYLVNCRLDDLIHCTRVYVCEGFATAATVAAHGLQLPLGHIGKGQAVVFAVDSGNLEPVIQSIYREYPHLKFVIMADDDRLKARETGINAGRTTAEALAAKYPYVRAVFPQFPPNAPLDLTDFNDLYVWQQQTQGGMYEPR